MRSCCFAILTVLVGVYSCFGQSHQKLADDTPWTFSPEKASVFDSFSRFPMDYEVALSRPQEKFGIINIQVLKDGKQVVAWQGHQHSVFVKSENVLVYADFQTCTSGCSVVAFDLQSRKQLWKTDLRGLGPIDHFEYSNQVNLDVVMGAVRVFGQEAAGNYLEFVDLKSGKTVGHRIYGR